MSLELKKKERQQKPILRIFWANNLVQSFKHCTMLPFHEMASFFGKLGQ